MFRRFGSRPSSPAASVPEATQLRPSSPFRTGVLSWGLQRSTPIASSVSQPNMRGDIATNTPFVRPSTAATSIASDASSLHHSSRQRTDSPARVSLSGSTAFPSSLESYTSHSTRSRSRSPLKRVLAGARSKRRFRCLFLGYRESGKSSIIEHVLYALNPATNPCPAMSETFRFSTTKAKSHKFALSDEAILEFIDTPYNYCQPQYADRITALDPHIIVFVINFNDTINLPLARQQLHRLVRTTPPHCRIIVVSSKEDLTKGVRSRESIQSYLGLKDFPTTCTVLQVSICADESSSESTSSPKKLGQVILALYQMYTSRVESS